MIRNLFFCFFIFITNSYSQPPKHLNYDSLFRENDRASKNAIDKPFSDFDISNDRIQLSKSKLLGKIVYINFWFSACSPCMMEMPQLNDLYTKFKSDTNFVFISISSDKEDKIKIVKSKYNIEYEVFSLPVTECNRLNISHSYPANIILDTGGIVRLYETGGKDNKLSTRRYFERKIYRQIIHYINER